jgi:TATA-box binding protein (TBP) (component of TFIID and TFIIIB)
MNSSQLKINPYRISTMVITGNLGAPINLTSLFQQLPGILIPIGYPDVGILKMEHKDAVVGVSARDALTHRRVASKTFFNQSTLVIRRPFKGGWKEANLKLFANGGFQMTGIPTEEFARETILWLIQHLQDNLKTKVWPEDKTPNLVNCNIQLLNSDYTINATVLRAKLHRILTKQYNLFSTYESTIYQGVNTKYYYNEARKPEQAAGICNCTSRCSGQGSGKGEGECKKITISAFQTGSIIITGARYLKQIDEAYEYFNNILNQHCSEILQPIPIEEPKEPKTSSRGKSKVSVSS